MSNEKKRIRKKKYFFIFLIDCFLRTQGLVPNSAYYSKNKNLIIMKNYMNKYALISIMRGKQHNKHNQIMSCFFVDIFFSYYIIIIIMLKQINKLKKRFFNLSQLCAHIHLLVQFIIIIQFKLIQCAIIYKSLPEIKNGDFFLIFSYLIIFCFYQTLVVVSVLAQGI